MINKICIVAIAKDEEAFIDEWLIYHKLIGINHFFIYDDSDNNSLNEKLNPYSEYVTIVKWFDIKNNLNEFENYERNQIKAYNHALKYFIKDYEWVCFIDIDEFIVLKKHNNIDEFLEYINPISAVMLNWVLFGHNGYYENPKNLIIESLIRRRLLPSIRYKSITKVNRIINIESAHRCNIVKFSYQTYPDKTKHFNPNSIDIACINHYQCRSFKNWMHRAKRGDVFFTPNDVDNIWRYDEEKLLKQFINISTDRNEFIDDYMLKYSNEINSIKKSINI